MSAAKHTPDLLVFPQHRDRFKVGDYSRGAGPYRVIADCNPDGSIPEEEAAANARLFAAAGDLLDSLLALFGADMEHVLMGDGKDDQVEAIAKARAAIAKATGSAA